VINEEPAAYACPGVNLDPGQKPSDVGDKATQEMELPLPQEVSYPVQPESMQAGIATEHLQDGPGRRIFAEDGLNILPNPL
jgi:hypothetical protein